MNTEGPLQKNTEKCQFGENTEKWQNVANCAR
jgi:hypothetical protein